MSLLVEPHRLEGNCRSHICLVKAVTPFTNAHAGSRTRVTSMGGLYMPLHCVRHAEVLNRYMVWSTACWKCDVDFTQQDCMLKIVPVDLPQICRFLNFVPYKCLRIRSLPEMIPRKIAALDVIQICRFLNLVPYKCLRIWSLPGWMKKIADLDVAQICRFWYLIQYKCLRIRSRPEMITAKSLLSMSLRFVGFLISPCRNAYECEVSQDW